MTTNTLRSALRMAKAIIEEDLDGTITGYSHPERTERAGVECLTDHGYFFHVDTITDPGALAEIRRFKRALRLIEKAMLSLTSHK